MNEPTRFWPHFQVAICSAGPAHTTISLVLLLGSTLFAASGNGDPNGTAIVVNSIDTASVPGRVTLRDALDRATRDPADNLIVFESNLLARGQAIQLNRPLQISSDNAGHDQIKGTLPDHLLRIEATRGAAFVVTGRSRLTLSNLVIIDRVSPAVIVQDQAQVELKNVCIRDGADAGLASYDESRIHLQQCRLVGNQTFGIELHQRASAVLTDVECTRNVQAGIAAFDDSTITATGSTFLGNGEWNLVLIHRAHADLIRCDLAQAEFANIDASGTTHLAMTNCTLSESPRFGVFATDRSSLVLNSCRLSNQGGRCIELQTDARLVIRSSLIERNGSYGLIAFGRSSVDADQTAFNGHTTHGVCLRNRASGQFDQCTFADNQNSGLTCPDARDGGSVRVSRCVFTGNGRRPIDRGPLHIDPLAPTPILIAGPIVQCLTEPCAVVELYIDRVGEAAQYRETVQADHRGQFQIDTRTIPDGFVMTASATVSGSTSEFNVIGGSFSVPMLAALTADTGPLSDCGTAIDPDHFVRRWRNETTIVFELLNPPSQSVRDYAGFLRNCIGHWTGTAVHTDVRFGGTDANHRSTVSIPVRYASPFSTDLMNRGGIAYLKWDAEGCFASPMKIVLARGDDPKQTCPRILAHEIGHTLGLCHARAGLLSRMQGSIPPDRPFVNDFSPVLTYYDVLALHFIYSPHDTDKLALRHLLDRAMPHHDSSSGYARGPTPLYRDTFSPPSTPASTTHQASRP